MNRSRLVEQVPIIHTGFLRWFRDRPFQFHFTIRNSNFLQLLLKPLRDAVRHIGRLAATGASLLLCIEAASSSTGAAPANGVRKLGNVVIYEDPQFYAAFPSIVRRPNRELLAAFRRAPERRALGEPGVTHTDP